MALKSLPCAYCGTTAVERTKGHVIPRSIYPDTLPNAPRITVPECLKCKARWDDAEPHFRNVMIAIWDPERTVIDNRYAKMKRSFSKRDGVRRLSEFAAQMISKKTPKGERETIYPTRDPKCNLILRRIVRGLSHFHEFGSPIADTRVRCGVMLWTIPDAFRSSFTWHEIAPGFCRYAYSIVGDENLHSFWLIRFSKHIEFFGAIATGA